MNAPVTTEEFLSAVRAHVAAIYPGQLCEEVRLKLTWGKIVLVVPPMPSVETETTSNSTEAELRRAIINALDSSDEHLKSSTLAKKVGRQPSGSFRALLKKMKEDGDVTVDSDGQYMLPDE